MELNYALLKNNRVVNVIVVEKQDDKAIKTLCDEMGFDEFIFTGDDKIKMHSIRVGTDFIEADFDYLKSIGLSTFDNAEHAAWQAKQSTPNLAE
jgi:hypothetical protein